MGTPGIQPWAKQRLQNTAEPEFRGSKFSGTNGNRARESKRDVSLFSAIGLLW